MAKGNKDNKDEVVEPVVEKEVEPVVEKEVKKEVKNELDGMKPGGPDAEATDEVKVKTPNFIPGQVFGTSRLKMHDRPGGGKTVIKKLLLKGEGVTVNLKDSTENYYKVSYGVAPHVLEGFSLKKYIQV